MLKTISTKQTIYWEKSAAQLNNNISIKIACLQWWKSKSKITNEKKY